MSLTVTQAPQSMSAMSVPHHVIVCSIFTTWYAVHFHPTIVIMDVQFFRCICFLIIFTHSPCCNSDLVSGQATCPHRSLSNPNTSVKLSAVTFYQQSGIFIFINFPFLNNQILQFPSHTPVQSFLLVLFTTVSMPKCGQLDVYQALPRLAIWALYSTLSLLVGLLHVFPSLCFQCNLSFSFPPDLGPKNTVITLIWYLSFLSAGSFIAEVNFIVDILCVSIPSVLCAAFPWIKHCSVNNHFFLMFPA